MSQTPIVILVLVLATIAAIGTVVGIRLWQKRRRILSLLRRRGDSVRYAFVINPSKPEAKQNREHIERYCDEHHLGQFMIIETELDKDGGVCAREALAQGADVVIAVGGDGTVRTVASAMSGTGHAMGIVPTGTGNLLARNLGIPLDNVDAALTVATSHGSRKIDVGRITLLDGDDDHAHAFLIVAGMGFDALMIDDTDPELKKNISWLAYFIGGVKNLFAPKYHGRVTIVGENGETHTTHDLTFRTLLAGNCGEIPMFSLMPEASFDDGLLDFEIIDTSGGLLGWASLFGDVVHQTITGKAEQSPLSTNSSIEQVQGISAEIVLEKPALVQADGDMIGESGHIGISVERQSLMVRVPENTAA
ncbi:diacylglycerol kinase family protein [uncultured Bifidobacterium sp.]|uniref:diacylglycerol/lipid kinase family protein n=1 Tax=uncultured Bifidobacterium sp. TaxID=165187 RepID=UPI002604F054|nr:diacylglycerol kinase family protein [uncultured Bifidobacterium sp.]